MTVALLSLHQVAFSYPKSDADALEDITFDIRAGTVTAIIGPNGAGKSTLLHIILGRHIPKRGRVLLRGAPLDAYSRRTLSRTLGLVPQREHVPFDYRIIEYVLLGRTPHLGFLATPRAEDLEQARAALHSLGLDALADRTVTSLSGGEHQLALIARTLAQAPQIILLDEPTSHLDLANKKRVLRIMRSLADQGMTVIYTTHDPESAAAIADRVVLMRDGRVLRHGPLQEIFNAANLSQTYGTELEVAQVGGTNVILLNL
ncbi:MAG TPA: ABC transporter ATP-binding protein [Chloroflexi bacterium]|nr:ABC transporter ATP-binding protein [Chloroflexota bacterium]